MSAIQIPRSTTEREQLIRVIDAAQSLVGTLSDPRMPQDVREQARLTLHAAWGALNEFDSRRTQCGAL
jgi:hypothetical protein